MDLRAFFTKREAGLDRLARRHWDEAYERLPDLAIDVWPFREVRDLAPKHVVYDGERWRVLKSLTRAARCRKRSEPDIFLTPAIARCLPARTRATLRDAVLSARDARWPDGDDRYSLGQVFGAATRMPPARDRVDRMLTTSVPAKIHEDLREVLPGLAGPRWFGDLVPFLRSLTTRIAQAKSRVTMRLGDRTLDVLSEPLGHGNFGIVHATTDGRHVVKLARPYWWAMFSVVEEAPSERYWAAVARRGGFTVPRTLQASAAGVYAVRNRLRDESLADFLTARRLFVYRSRSRQYEPGVSLQAMTSDVDIQTIWSGVEAMIRGIRQTRRFPVSLAPNNVFVEYAGTASGKPRPVARVGLVDVGPVLKDSYGRMDSPIAYLEYCADRLTKYRQEG